MKRDGDGYLLSTGRHIYANDGIIGLTPDDNTLYEGYDGSVEEMGGNLSPEEVVEIADFMIALWTNYRTRHTQGEKGSP